MIQPARLVPIQITDSGRALILVRGFLSRREQTEKESEHWWIAIRESGWPHSIYQLWWDASTPYRFSTNLLATALAPGMPLKALAAASEALRHWRMVRNRAESTGVNDLHKLLAPIAHERLTLVGFSLGALMLYHGLRQPQNQSYHIERLIMMGGALSPNSRDWRAMMAGVDGGLINLYNPNDHVLKYFYRLSYLPLPDRDQIAKLLPDKAPTLDEATQSLRRMHTSIKSGAQSLGDHIRLNTGKGLQHYKPDLSAGRAAIDDVWAKLKQDGLPKPPTPCGLRPIDMNSPEFQWRVINSDMSAPLGNHVRNHWHYWRVLGEALQGY